MDFFIQTCFFSILPNFGTSSRIQPAQPDFCKDKRWSNRLNPNFVKITIQVKPAQPQFLGKIFGLSQLKRKRGKKKKGRKKKNKWKIVLLTVYKLGWTGSIRFVRSVKNKQYRLHSICLVQKLWLIRLNSKIVYYDWKRVDPAHVDCCRNNVDMGRIIWTLQKQQCRVEPAAPAALN